MLSYTILNKLPRGKNQRGPQNLDNPKEWTDFGTGLSIGQLILLHQVITPDAML